MDIEDLSLADTHIDDAATTAQRLRQVLGAFATGVTIVTTTAADGRRIGLTVNSFNSVSLDPPLILWGLAKKSANLQHFLAAERFAVHILSADQAELAQRFARPVEDRFSGLPLHDRDDVPLLEDCAAVLVCETEQTVDAGDHHVFIARVVSMGAANPSPDPLLFFRGRLRELSTPCEP